MFRSATFKLTLWYIAIVMAISIAFSFVVFHFATAELATGLNHQTQRWYNNYPVFDDDPFFTQHGELTNAEHHILLRLAYFNLIVLVAAGIASYALARRTLKPIEEAHARQKRFTADVSHELRTPLTAIRMETEVMLMDENPTKQELKATLHSNLEETQKLELLINNLLRLTHLEAGQLEQKFTRLSALQLVNEAIAVTKKSADAKQITFENTARDIPVQGDSGSLVQLVAIMLDNAIKYSPEASSVHIDTKKVDNAAHIIIKDHGIGIEPQALKHIFERFYRADKARTKKDTSGFGLGLSIAKQIADVHHGAITITSRVNHGTTIDIALPSR